MLALTRNPGQAVVLTTASGETITVYVTRHVGRATRLAIDAPQSVRIVRAELAAKEQAQCPAK